VIDSRGWASFEHRIALSCFNFAIFFSRGFSATTKKACLRGDPSVGLTIIVEALILLKNTAFDPSKNVRQLRLADWRADVSPVITAALF
jgi:hypothetical protein